MLENIISCAAKTTTSGQFGQMVRVTPQIIQNAHVIAWLKLNNRLAAANGCPMGRNYWHIKHYLETLNDA